MCVGGGGAIGVRGECGENLILSLGFKIRASLMF